MKKIKPTSKITFQGIGKADYINNYVQTATVFGCTDPTQFNYDPLANADDGSCVPYIYGCTTEIDPTTSVANYNYDSSVNTDDGSCYPVILGCTDPTAFNFISLVNDVFIDVNTDDGSCIPVVLGCTDDGTDPNFPGRPQSFVGEATNYNSLANTENGTCTYITPGCTDSLARNHDPAATVDDGSCEYWACGIPGSINYNPNASPTGPIYFTDNTLCQGVPVLGCMDPSSSNYAGPGNTLGPGGTELTPVANTDDGSCIPCVNGCTNPLAFNYNQLATCDDGSCITVLPPGNIPQATLEAIPASLGGFGNIIELTTEAAPISMLYPPTRFEYNVYQGLWYFQGNQAPPPESISYGTLNGNTKIIFSFNTNVPGELPGAGVVHGSITWFWENVNGDVIYTEQTFSDPALSSIPNSIPNPTSTEIVYGCTNLATSNFTGPGSYDPLATWDDGSCIPPVFGCTDSNAMNYFAAATVDNGSCIYGGCGNPNANNYAGSSFTYNGLPEVWNGTGGVFPVGTFVPANTFPGYNPIVPIYNNSTCVYNSIEIENISVGGFNTQLNFAPHIVDPTSQIVIAYRNKYMAPGGYLDGRGFGLNSSYSGDGGYKKVFFKRQDLISAFRLNGILNEPYTYIVEWYDDCGFQSSAGVTPFDFVNGNDDGRWSRGIDADLGISGSGLIENLYFGPGTGSSQSYGVNNYSIAERRLNGENNGNIGVHPLTGLNDNTFSMGQSNESINFRTPSLLAGGDPTGNTPVNGPSSGGVFFASVPVSSQQVLGITTDKTLWLAVRFRTFGAPVSSAGWPAEPDGQVAEKKLIIEMEIPIEPAGYGGSYSFYYRILDE